MIATALHKKNRRSRPSGRDKAAKKHARRPKPAPLAKRIPRGATFRRQEIRCGKGHCWCRWGGMAHGPYWYAFWKEAGRTRSAYIGDEDKLRQLLNDRHDLRDPDEDLVAAPAPRPAADHRRQARAGVVSRR